MGRLVSSSSVILFTIFLSIASTTGKSEPSNHRKETKYVADDMDADNGIVPNDVQYEIYLLKKQVKVLTDVMETKFKQYDDHMVKTDKRLKAVENCCTASTTTTMVPTTVYQKNWSYVGEGYDEHADEWLGNSNLHSLSACLQWCSNQHGQDGHWNGCQWNEKGQSCQVKLNARGFMSVNEWKFYYWK